MYNPQYYTAHSLWRMRRRAISAQDVAYVLCYGTELRRAGVDHVVLLRKNIPAADRRIFGHLAGTILLWDNGTLITAYKNRGGQTVKLIRRKSKLDHSAFWRPPPDYQ